MVTITPEIEDHIRLHYPTKGTAPTAKAFGLKPHLVCQMANSIGIEMTQEAFRQLQSDSCVRESHEYPVNPDQFKTVTTPEVAYLFGLLWADGHLQSVKKSGNIRLHNQTPDMEDIKSVFDKTGNWGFYSYPKRQPTWKGQTMVVGTGRPLFELFRSLDYESKNASPDKVLSHIPESLRHYWWRGYFDGDGCLYLGKWCHQVVFAGPHDQDWTFAEELCRQLNVRYAITQKTSKKGHRSSAFRISGIRNCQALLGPMYTGYEQDGIGFTRKWKKYEELRDMVPQHPNTVPPAING